MLRVKSFWCWPTAFWLNSYRFREVCSPIVDSCCLISMYICCSLVQYGRCSLFIFRTCLLLVNFYLAWRRCTLHLKMQWMEYHQEDRLLRWQFPQYWTKLYLRLVLETLRITMSWYVLFMRGSLVPLLSMHLPHLFWFISWHKWSDSVLSSKFHYISLTNRPELETWPLFQHSSR